MVIVLKMFNSSGYLITVLFLTWDFPAFAEEEEVVEIPEDVVIQGGHKSRRDRIRKFFRLKPKKELTALEKYEKQKEKERKKKAKKNKKGKSEPRLLHKIVCSPIGSSD